MITRRTQIVRRKCTKYRFLSRVKRLPTKLFQQILILLSLLFINFPLQAEVVDLSQDYWQCAAHDGNNKEWTAASNYQLTALNRAYESCKKESSLPTSCKTSKNDCEAFISGYSTRPMWQCTALDDLGNPWVSNVYRNADDAVLAAKAYCRQESPYPDSCYAYLLACDNLNSHLLD